MATGELYSEVAELVGSSQWISEIGDNAKRERITAGAREMLSQQVGGSLCAARASSADHFDVVAFPVHLSGSGSLHHRSSQGLKIGDGNPEADIGIDRPAQCHHGLSAVGGSLRAAVPRCRLWIRTDGSTMILDRQRDDGSVISRATGRWFHDRSVQEPTEVPLRRC
jgi:hypothetical protein